jgi:ubiquinone/menaquinone biosynthesis C-methylase UbiE
LIILTIILNIFLLLKNVNTKSYYEGFEQKEKFILKTNNNIYDDFYIDIYDQLQKTDQRTDVEVQLITNSVELNNSTILDIGCGTGYLVNKLQNLNNNVYGVDKSKNMISYCQNKFPNINVKLGDVNDSMLYDINTFTHILCTNFTIYEFNDKIKLLKNCYNWLIPHGLFIVHVVDRKNFSPIIPLGKPIVLDNPQKYSKIRITDTLIDFLDFTYKASYNFNNVDNNNIIIKETFTDVLTKNIRQNEMNLLMENIDDLIKIFNYCGFKMKTKISMEPFNGDEYQFLCVFECFK